MTAGLLRLTFPDLPPVRLLRAGWSAILLSCSTITERQVAAVIVTESDD
jgi:hypothetical protein